MRQVPFLMREILCNSSSEAVFESTKLKLREIFRKSGYNSTAKSKSKYTTGKTEAEVGMLCYSIHHLVKVSPQTQGY